jgi:hypothetical protein
MLCQLLLDAQVLADPSDGFSLNTELLLIASSSIRSSLAKEGFHDLGTRLSIRLLLPHIKTGSDMRITATLVETLEHHSPKTDAEANNLLSLCRKLVERKNTRVLDGCDAICLARYQYYLRECRPGGAVHWLVTGMELESLVLCEGSKRSGAWLRALSSGVCFRRLVAELTETSHSLLKKLFGEETQGAAVLYSRANEMLTALDESNLASFLPSVKVLENVRSMAKAIKERKDKSVIATSIIACLEERADDEDDGVVSSLAPSCMHLDLLRLAQLFLNRDGEDSQLSVSCFDVKGMGVLLSTFTNVTKTLDMKKQLDATISPIELQEMRLALGEGLKRAFVTENSMKKAAASRKHKTSVVGLYAANFARVGREEQERAVNMMLEY